MPYNRHEEVAASGTRSGTNTHNGSNYKHVGGFIYVDVTATNGDGTQDLQITLRGKDKSSGTMFQIFQDEFTNGATGSRVYAVYPGIADTQANFDLVEEVPMPFKFDIETQVLQGGSSPDFTYSIGIDLFG